MTRQHRNISGFTLIELLVVVLIIGILASIAIPQYFKVVERAKLAEAQAFISNVKNSNERYLARTGTYLTNSADLDKLDVSFPGSSPFFGMKNFKVDTLSGATCSGNNDPGYTVKLQRITANSGVSPRYGEYKVTFNRCAGDTQYDSCTNCDTDFK